MLILKWSIFFGIVLQCAATLTICNETGLDGNARVQSGPLDDRVRGIGFQNVTSHDDYDDDNRHEISLHKGTCHVL